MNKTGMGIFCIFAQDSIAPRPGASLSIKQIILPAGALFFNPKPEQTANDFISYGV